MKIRLKVAIRLSPNAPNVSLPGEIVDVDKDLAEGLILIDDAEEVSCRAEAIAAWNKRVER